MSTPIAAAFLAIALGYLIGSVPFGLLLTRVAGLGDIRTIGSGNIGATNVLRTGNKWLAAVVLLLDGAKGTAAIVLAGALADPVFAPLAGLACVLGHMFPVWIRFRGGKGVATGIGVLLGAAWLVGVGLCVVWLVMAIIFRISSLAALAGFAVAPILALLLASPKVALLALAITMLVAWRHHENITRLRAGTEPLIGANP
ncbi:MAG: glycerol-3-phosphate 1-O-acyltransferase [Acetobacteraceae bacterium]|nr:glycerol-3-phosphate 1-O-acyltransferase [Acetobacteraceae bacterium]